MQIVPCLLCVVFCFCLTESAPSNSTRRPPSIDDPPTTSATTDGDADTLDIFVKAALIFAFFAVTLICCVVKCRCFGPGDASSSSIWFPFLNNTADNDQERLRHDTDRTRTESQGYPFAPASPPPVLEAYIGDCHAHPIDSRHLPPPPSYIDALQFPKKPRLNSDTWSELSR